MTKISFQGEFGAYSHLACIEVFSDCTPIPCETFETALENVYKGMSDYAMLPVENSVAGRVADIHYMLSGYDLKIYAEHFQKVEHQLLGIKGSSLDTIENVRSHTMAVGQCGKIIKELGLKPIVMADTAGSAKYLNEQGTNKDSAIASKLAADTYGLQILKENIQDLSLIHI